MIKTKPQCLRNQEHDFKPRGEYLDTACEEDTGWISMPVVIDREKCTNCGCAKLVRTVIGHGTKLSTRYESEALS